MRKITLVSSLSAAALAVFMVFQPDEKTPEAPIQLAPRLTPQAAPLPAPIVVTPAAAVGGQDAASLPTAVGGFTKQACPITKTDDPSQILEEMNYRAAQRDLRPLDKFKHTFNAFISTPADRFNELGLTRREYGQKLQLSAQAAFKSLISVYPHGRLQAMDQSADLGAEIRGQEMSILMEVHTLRWSMSNLIVDSNAVPDVQMGTAVGGYDREVLNRVIARLSIAAYPEAVKKLKAMTSRDLFDVDSVDDYERYVELVEYVGSGSAYTDAEMTRPEWPELGFENRKAWLTFKRGSENKIAAQKEVYAKTVIAACAPASVSR